MRLLGFTHYRHYISLIDIPPLSVCNYLGYKHVLIQHIATVNGIDTDTQISLDLVSKINQYARQREGETNIIKREVRWANSTGKTWH